MNYNQTHLKILISWAVTAIGMVAIWLFANSNNFANNPLDNTCKILSVYDGDTLRASCRGEIVKVRLYCIDAPEMQQPPWGIESRDYLRSMLEQGSTIHLNIIQQHQDGRKVGAVVTTENINLNMVQTGHAAVYPQYCRVQNYYTAEQQAKAAALGIFAKSGLHQTPWKYRARSK